jgi:peptidoglycan/xylan/chitin deacetylase (PgdA/CDA1 family)
MSERGFVFLMYHELELPGRPLCHSDKGYSVYAVEEKHFRSQMRWLQQTGWRGLSVGEAFALKPQTEDAKPSVVITFDDGCATDLNTAAPILQESGYNATFYITVGFLGLRGYMNSSQLRELSTLGFEIGCHSLTHAYLTDLDRHGLHREIVESKTQLEQIVGKPVKHISCPGGRYDANVVQALREAGYASVATSRVHGNNPKTDRFALGRIAVQRHLGLPAFQRICQSQGLWKLHVRQLLGNTAKRVLGNTLYDHAHSLLLR